MAIGITRLVSQKMRSKYFDRIFYPKVQDFEQFPVDENCEKLSIDDENIAAQRVGTMVDLLTRAYLLHDEDTFVNAKKGWSTYLKANPDTKPKLYDLLVDHVMEEIRKETPLDKLSKRFFECAEWLAELEDIYRGGNRVYHDQLRRIDCTTSDHVREMLRRSQLFFERYGNPTQINFHVASKHGMVVGDGDYLNRDHLIDFKTSVDDPRTRIEYRLQLLLYYYLGYHRKTYPEFATIKGLILFNPRTGIAEVCPVEKIEALVDIGVSDVLYKLGESAF